MKNFLFLGDYNTPSGFASVMHNLVAQLNKYYHDKANIRILATNYHGPNESIGNVSFRSAQLYMPEPEQQDSFGLHALIQDVTDRTREGQPYDGVFILQDPGHINGVASSLEHVRRMQQQMGLKVTKYIVYFPVDYDNSPPELFDMMDFYDHLVMYNEYSRSQVLKLFPEYKDKSSIIPHGVNTHDFFPMEKEKIKEFRDEYFGKNAGKFIITNVNSNRHRKDIPCTIFAFKEYLRTNADAFLYLHMPPVDPKGWNLYRLLRQLDLHEGIHYQFPSNADLQKGISNQTLNKIYNASDVFVTTTLGGGWELTVTEAMACKLPVICPLHTSLTEITDHGRRAFGLENLYPICHTNDSVAREQCDFIEVAETLEAIGYGIKLSSADKTAQAYAYALQIDWNNVGKRWVQLFKEIF